MQVSAAWREVLGMRLTTRLPLTIAAIALLAVLVTSTVSLWLAAQEVVNQDKVRIETVAKTRALELSRYLETVAEDIRFQSANPYLRDALGAFVAGWESLASETGGAPTDRLQRLYIEDNPNPVGKKENLDAAGDGSLYSAAHGRFHPWIRTFLRERGYYDVFLVDKTGSVVYTVFKELDYATNVLTGKYHKTGLGTVAKAVLQRGAAIAFDDFKPYAPSADAPAAFIGAPVKDPAGAVVGALVFQFPIDRVNALMQSTAGLGETGETLIVGDDFLVRSASRFVTESTILKVKLP